jgi:hypothetical protein
VSFIAGKSETGILTAQAAKIRIEAKQNAVVVPTKAARMIGWSM